MAAVYVVCFHLAAGWLPCTKGLIHLALTPFQFGHWAVILFIVISGFCLMLPVVQDRSHELPKGRKWFFERRARRILPGYYAALLLSLLMPFASAHGLKDFLAGNLHITHTPLFEHFSLANVLAHLTLVYNWHPDWVSAFNWPLWSVAAEVQIYVLFAFLLLPIWKRFGNIGAVLVAWVLGTCPLIISPHWNLQWTAPWMAGAFAFGMAGAQWVVEQRSTRWAAPLGLACLGLFCVVRFLPGAEGASASVWFLVCEDLLAGVGATALIVWCAQRQSGQSWLVRLLESRPLLHLGLISYSIYLLHVPIMQKFSGLNDILARLPLPIALRILIWFAFILAGVILAATAFYSWIEAPFLRRRG